MNKGYTVAQVAEKLDCHPNTVKRLEKKLKLEVKRDYRNYRQYSDDVILKLMQYINQVN